jgi:Na+/H+ antiporter NhaD/arsenite permease-like protein
LYLFRRDLRRPATGAAAVMNLDPAKALTDPPVARKVLVVLGIAIALFFVHSLLGLSPAFIALSAAAAALVLVRPDLSRLFAHVEWSVLVFFMALFVMVGGLEAAGVLDRLGDLVLDNSMSNPVWFGVAIIWTVAILSAVVDNIPITIALIPVIQELGAGGVDIAPLWWALVFGAGFGGNGTIIGSTANVVVVSVSDRTRTPITAALWNRRGLPVMLLACAVATVLFVLLYPWLSR